MKHILTITISLVALRRDIEPSPFPGEDGRVFHFCGYDGGAGAGHNTAWIYRGSLLESNLEPQTNKP